MNEIDKAIKALQQKRDQTAARVEKAEQEAREARELLVRLDQSLAPLVSEGAGLRMPLKALQGKPPVMSDVQIRDVVTYAMTEKPLDFSLDDLVSHDELAAAISSPATRSRTLKNIWDSNLTKMIEQMDGAERTSSLHFIGDGLNIAQNTALDSGLGLTTLNVRKTAGAESVALHILHNKKSDKAMVVGGKLPSRLREAFKKANIHYIDRTAVDAKAQVESALTDVVGAKPQPYIRQRLLDAFKYRNGLEDEAADKTVTDIAAALVDPKMETFYPKYVVRMK